MKSQKIFESEKRKPKTEKIIEKLKAKSKISNLENCKWKAKVEVLWFRFPTLIVGYEVLRGRVGYEILISVLSFIQKCKLKHRER